MKRIISLLLSLTFIFLLSSCNTKPNSKTDVTKTTKADSQEETEVSLEEQNLNNFFDYIGAWRYPEPEATLMCDSGTLTAEKTDDAINEIVDISLTNTTTAAFITKDGSLYSLSLYTGTCKKIKSDKKFVRFLDYDHTLDTINIVDENNQFYNFKTGYKLKKHNDAYSEFEFLKGEDLSKVFLIDNDFFKVKRNSIYSVETGKLLYTFPDDEQIEFFFENTIKTNKGFYNLHKKYGKKINKINATSCSLSFEADFVAFTARDAAFPLGKPYIIIVDNYVYVGRLT